MTALAERSDPYMPPPVAMEPWCADGPPAVDPPGPSKYYRARYYDPKIGRFISEDPIGFTAGVNFYTYVENNPVNRVDPLGLTDEKCIWFGGGFSAAIGIGVRGSAELGVCKDKCGEMHRKRRVCICSSLGGGFSAGGGASGGDTSTQYQGWEGALAAASLSGDFDTPFPTGLSSGGLGLFYHDCRCSIYDGWF